MSKRLTIYLTKDLPKDLPEGAILLVGSDANEEAARRIMENPDIDGLRVVGSDEGDVGRTLTGIANILSTKYANCHKRKK